MQTVIIVDDDRTNAALLKMLLEMDGFNVIVAPSASRAREALINGVDALVIDCNLAQDGDGIDLLHAIRRGETLVAAEIPVILTSGDDRRTEEARTAGASLFLLKPYSPSILSKQLTQLLR